MLRPLTAWLVPIVLTAFSLGSNVKSALAQIQYPFETTYTSETTLVPITANILRITSQAENDKAPYGLNRLVNVGYGDFNSQTGVITISPNPAEFGLPDLPTGNFTIFGPGQDQIFGTARGTATLDFQNFVGNVTNTLSITGGTGRFNGATGTLNLLENITLNSTDPTAPTTGMPLIKGLIVTPQTVPEPSLSTAIIAMGIIGVASYGCRKIYSTNQ
ncbi:hypothetical protein NIES4071_104760 (plasmid) [Calothrix sp. NIES-4071]|nr:hypothetical protein NIES4071_104760 [Calothrix sp. NIES-4071]BAZ64894.1 hypothetical protein NIES4105_106270 [Calothrix sp. NIES-4105]